MCHKTASLVANELECANVATVVIGTMHKPLERVPRAIVTRSVDAPVGPPGDAPFQRHVVERALRLLTTAMERTHE